LASALTPEQTSLLTLLIGFGSVLLCAFTATATVAAPLFPACNAVTATDAALVARGRALFADSGAFGARGPFPTCATCHGEAIGFTDNLNHAVAPTQSHTGRPGLPDTNITFPRSNPGLLQNLAETAPYTWDGRAACLQQATFGAINSPLEMGGRVNPNAGGQAQLDAIAAFLLSLRPPPPQPGADPAAVARGRDLFLRPDACIRCHSGPNLTDNQVHNHGIPDDDPGAGLVGTGPAGAFDTPQLRGVRLTAPYFHNGRNGIPAGSTVAVATEPGPALRQVVEFYDRRANLGLSAQDREDLVAFLLALGADNGDRTPPGPTTATVAGGVRDAGGRYTVAPTIALAATDAASGVAATYYRFVPPGTPPPANALSADWARYAAAFVPPVGEGDLYAFSLDGTGNAETPRYLGTFRVAPSSPSPVPSTLPGAPPGLSPPNPSPSPNAPAMPSASPSPAIGPAPRFADVPGGYWAHDQIAQFAQRGITTGCGDEQGRRLYCPERGVTRAEMATFITRTLGQDKVTPPATPTFADVPTDYWAYTQIEAFAQLGITTGCGLDELGRRLYCPDRGVTRAEMAAFLDRAKGQSELVNPTATFADVPADYWAYGWIERFFTLGVTTGCGEDDQGRKVYCPDRGVTRAEMAVFIIRAYP